MMFMQPVFSETARVPNTSRSSHACRMSDSNAQKKPVVHVPYSGRRGQADHEVAPPVT